MVSGEVVKWGAIGVKVIFSQAHPFVGVQIKDIRCATIIHHQAMDVTVGDLSCDHQGIDMWVMDLSSIDLSENYVFMFHPCLLSGSCLHIFHVHGDFISPNVTH